MYQGLLLNFRKYPRTTEGFSKEPRLTYYWEINPNIITEGVDIAKLRQGDPVEARQFARQVVHWTWHLVLSYVQNVQDTEEIIQDTLLAALEGLTGDGRNAFRKASSVKSWVYSIARHKAQDALRRKYAQKRSAKVIPLNPDREEDLTLPFEPADFIHPGVLLETQEQMQLLFAGINQLPLQQKEALLLAKFEQMPIREIAEIMNTTPKAVESLLQRAKHNFKTYLEHRGININRNHGSA